MTVLARPGSVLTFRLAGPLQSWSTAEGLGVRTTGSVPSKSGVLGLMAAALGRQRGEDMSDLRELGLLVRVDHVGSELEDFHTVSRYSRPAREGKAPILEALVDGASSEEFAGPGRDVLIKRQRYLTDAVFVAALVARDEAGDELLARIGQALAAPVFPLYLGRKGCPAEPLMPQLHQQVSDPVALITDLPWTAGGGARRQPQQLMLAGDQWLLAASAGSSVTMVADDPVGHHRYSRRAQASVRTPWPEVDLAPPPVRGFTN